MKFSEFKKNIDDGIKNVIPEDESSERLKNLEVETFCADHYGYLTGEEARDYIPKTIEMARNQRTLIEKVYRRDKDIDLAAKRLVDSQYDQNPDYFLSPEIAFDVQRQMVRHIASAMEEIV